MASYYYLRHTTLDVFTSRLGPDMDVAGVLQVRVVTHVYFSCAAGKCTTIHYAEFHAQRRLLVMASDSVVVVVRHGTFGSCSCGGCNCQHVCINASRKAHMYQRLLHPQNTNKHITQHTNTTHKQALVAAPEYDELPVRHNEDKLNAAMARTARCPVDARSPEDPHVKAHLLLQVWVCGCVLLAAGCCSL